MARLDRLGAAKEIAQIGAVIGREFSHALLAAVAGKAQVELQSALHRLMAAGLLFRQGVPPHANYLFKHALVQDAAYGTLLREPRLTLHARIAETLRDRFTIVADAEPEVVAHHFTQAALAEAGIEWWSKAGERALRSSAYEEAIAHLEKALVLAGALAESPAQRLLRLRLQIAYGQALIHARGFAAPETAAAFSRAREFASGVEDVTERFPVYYGLLYGVCSLSIFRLDFPPGGARLYPLAKLPAESGGRRRGDFCFGYSDLAIGAVGAGGELGGVRSRSWRDRAAQVALRRVFSLDFQAGFSAWRRASLSLGEAARRIRRSAARRILFWLFGFGDRRGWRRR